MNILQKIVADKHREVADRKSIRPIKYLESSIFYESSVVSMQQYLKRPDKVGIIAEIKRSSPSAGRLAGKVDVRALSIGYMQAGATALSVLTDKEYFSGSNKDLEIARKFNYCPILRKDFIIDAYQVVESKSMGADCILLIAACLSVDQCTQLAKLAKSIGLEILLEVHSLDEVRKYVSDDIDIVGVNNRDLQTFETHLSTSVELATHLPATMTKISESGISTPKDIIELKRCGFDGFLIGTQFMKQAQPESACRSLIERVKSKLYEMESMRNEVSR